jgi:hypothetical protein
MGGGGQTVLLARGTRTIRMCSFNARSGNPFWLSKEYRVIADSGQ